jgi:hypothetical protein
MSTLLVLLLALVSGLAVAGLYWVSWTVAGAGLCVFAVIGLVYVCRPLSR